MIHGGGGKHREPEDLPDWFVWYIVVSFIVALVVMIKVVL